MIWLVRHGLDDETKIGGWSDVELTSEGIRQVEEIEGFLRKNVNFKEIISSDVKRAVQTAEILGKKLNKNITCTSLLREQSKGIYNGVSKASINDEKIFKELSIYDKFPKGESLLDLYFRIETLLLTMPEWEENLLVTHRGVINMIYYLLNNNRPDMYKDSFGAQHASVHKLDLKNKTIERIR